MANMIQKHNVVAVNVRDEMQSRPYRIENAIAIFHSLGGITPIYTICGQLYIDGHLICPDCAHDERFKGCGKTFIASHTSTDPSPYFEVRCKNVVSSWVTEIISMELGDGSVVELNWKIGGE